MSEENNRILRPDEVSIDEDKFYEFDISNLTSHYDKVFGKKREKKNFVKRKIFEIVLLTNKNIIIILAGSLASVPVNMLTGFSSLNSYTYFEVTLYALQLFFSFLFYFFFLKFVHSYIYIRERGNEYVNHLLAKSSHYSRKNVSKSIKNIEYFSCMEKYKIIRNYMICLLVFGILLIILLFATPIFLNG